MTKYTNPVISGFYPDPSVCRVNEDYYLVTSTFEYSPGVPVFHSKDLVHWQQIGHCLTSLTQLPLSKAWVSGGIYAPTIRYHEGWFYMTTTNIGAGGNLIVRTQDPAGSWSDPIFVAQGGIDPSLLFDDDGRVYFQSAQNGNEGEGIYQCEIDITTGKQLTDSRLIWRGTGGAAPEAPHLYKINDLYYLMIAEGGTEYGHMETIARSTNPYGPFDACPHNPILSNRSMKSSIHAAGHADLVQAQDGTWWAVCLGIRPPSYPMRHHLGRETFLAPVTWTDEGWPIIGDNGNIKPVMDAPELPQVQWTTPSVRDHFDEPTLGLEWMFLRNPAPASWSLEEQPGQLVLRGTSVSLDEVSNPAFVGRRLAHFTSHIATELTFEPQEDGEEAGLTLYMNPKYHYDLAIKQVNGQKKILLRRTVGSLKTEQWVACEAGPVILKIHTQSDQFLFSIQQNSSPELEVGSGETHLLSTEIAGGFTGVIAAMYATSPSGNGSPAQFDWFDYEPLEEV
ncbi:glycoside hydrolase family 43 protein [Paenibacillus sp. MER 99-2]|uniref:glycoside hydrolase family 43 protein n=1 Tax=Paenibacillus sp. MER 99-2 TaxID=2939572 RepID=UPI00203AD710|nr:glycoside hydrolase family 43 protein [Paenibacillus sp. MER 99-2]MCM3174413.1 glycoside hydrolase family 43 protein [Paenibacillus sp. MER 99-2]